MKQHITPDQAKQLEEQEFYYLFEKDGILHRPKDWYRYHHKKVTIGKMIEFLSNKYNENLKFHISPKDLKWNRVYIDIENGYGYSGELCDGLWACVVWSIVYGKRQ